MMQEYLPCTLALRHRSAAAQPNGHSYVCHGSIYWRTLFCLRQARRHWTARTSIMELATGARLCALMHLRHIRKPRAASCALVARVAEGGGKSGLPPKGALATLECAQVTSAPSLISRRLLGATAQDVIKEWQVSLTSLRCTLALHGLGGVIYFHHNGNKSKGDDPPRADPPRLEENVREQVKSEDAYRFGECRCAGCEARREATRRAIEEYRDVIPRRFDEVYAPQLDPIWELYEEESRNRSQDDHLDMDHDLIVEDIPATPEKRYEPDREQNEVLLGLQRDRRNIVLDSTCPEVAPHIVISPPDLNEEWDLYWAVWINRMGPQDPEYLSLPNPDCRLLATLPPHADRHKGSSVETLMQEPQYGDDDATLCSSLAEPRRVFSRSASQQREREVVYLDNVITAVRRHCYRASAIAASTAASTFRARWDAADFVIHLEKPFMWIDPAETLLSFFFQCLGTLVIDSTTPYTTPHIVIQEPLPENLWGLYHNNTPSPQDCGLGNLLTVPSSYVDYVNLEPNPFEEDEKLYDPADSRPSSSGMESNVPRTPEHLEDGVGVAVPAQCADIAHADQIPFSTSALWQTASQSEEPALHGDDIPTYEEEEDELPPFDEWYQSIARRTA